MILPQPLLADMGPVLMFIAGIGLLTAIMLRRTYRQLGRRKRQYNNKPIDAQPRPASQWEGAHTDSAAIVERERVELAEMSRDMNGQLDTKIMILRELIQQSQAQIERLEQLTGQLEKSEATMVGEIDG